MRLIKILPALALLLLLDFTIATPAASIREIDSTDKPERATDKEQYLAINDNDVLETFPPLSPGEIEISDNRPLEEAIPSDFNITQTQLTVVALNNLNLQIFSGPANCVCGRPSKKSISTFIINGDAARINDHPWAVAIVRRPLFGFGQYVQYCGATLINSRYVLTAAHCMDGMSTRGFEVRIPEEDFRITSEVEGGTKRVAAEQIVMHPNYNRRLIDNDIALIRLAEEIPMNGVFVPARLPANNNNLFDGANGTVVGWGSQKDGGLGSPTLMKAQVPIISNSDCRTKTAYTSKKITDNMMCAGDIEVGGKSSCKRDSGGPQVSSAVENDGRTTIVGVVSWSLGCAQPKKPGVYTRVGRYSDWIVANTKDANWCQG